ncbi:hypothetical protein ACIBF5_04275 [Micromonospora sp. NPDC050417]|uniref:hypothetical protein n=1 Tax=Micromonospora sp. NPDC050417 TaxID=3364280 RepID=UPI0037BB2578
MTDQLENHLARVLETAALTTAPTETDFVPEIRRRQRRRRQRRAVVASACAVALIVVGGLTTVRLTDAGPRPEPDDPITVATTWSGELPDFATLKSPEQVWPRAVRKLPGKLPNGDQYTVLAILDRDRYLVDTTQYAAILGQSDVVAQIRAATSPAVFDVRAGTVRGLGYPSTATGPVTFHSLSGVFVVGDDAVWLASRNLSHELWAAQLDGVTPPRLLHVLSNATPHIDLADESIYWRQSPAGSTPGGIYRIPVAGGEAALVPGSEAFYLSGLSTWVDTHTRQTPVNGEPPTGELWNLVTGERRTWAKSPTFDSVQCDPVLCLGNKAGQGSAVQRLDGGGIRTLGDQGNHPGSIGGSMSPALDGRFATGTVAIGGLRLPYIWDRFSGKAATVRTTIEYPPQDPSGPSPSPKAASFRSLPYAKGGVVQWSDGKGGTYLLDLKAIR